MRDTAEAMLLVGAASLLVSGLLYGVALLLTLVVVTWIRG